VRASNKKKKKTKPIPLHARVKTTKNNKSRDYCLSLPFLLPIRLKLPLPTFFTLGKTHTHTYLRVSTHSRIRRNRFVQLSLLTTLFNIHWNFKSQLNFRNEICKNRNVFYTYTLLQRYARKWYITAREQNIGSSKFNFKMFVLPIPYSKFVRKVYIPTNIFLPW
jgi:hypothetical protein